MTAALAENRHGGAVGLFMKLVGAPDEAIAGMGSAGGPMWDSFEELAPTLAYDHSAILGPNAAVPVEEAAKVRAPTIVMSGENSFPFMRETAETLSRAMPQGKLVVVEGQTHEVSVQALAPVLSDFFKE